MVVKRFAIVVPGSKTYIGVIMTFGEPVFLYTNIEREAVFYTQFDIGEVRALLTKHGIPHDVVYLKPINVTSSYKVALLMDGIKYG